MVHGVVSLGVFVPFEKWEINNPQGLEVKRISEAEFGAQVSQKGATSLEKCWFLGMMLYTLFIS